MATSTTTDNFGDVDNLFEESTYVFVFVFVFSFFFFANSRLVISRPIDFVVSNQKPENKPETADPVDEVLDYEEDDQPMTAAQVPTQPMTTADQDDQDDQGIFNF